MEKIFNQKSFKYFVSTALGNRVNIQINFFFKFILRCKQSCIVLVVCHRCYLYWWQICRRCRWHQWQICCWCCWYGWCTLTCGEFSDEFEMTLVLFSRGWGKMIHEKNMKQKSCDTVPLTIFLKGAPAWDFQAWVFTSSQLIWMDDLLTERIFFFTFEFWRWLLNWIYGENHNQRMQHGVNGLSASNSMLSMLLMILCGCALNTQKYEYYVQT
jgi:hypothetical protein